MDIVCEDAAIPQNLFAHETILLRTIASITANVVKMTIAHRFKFAKDAQSVSEKSLSCEESVKRALAFAYVKYYLAAGEDYYSVTARAKRLAQIDYDHIVALAQTIASNRCPKGL